MKRKLLIASRNRGKLAEIAEKMKDLPFDFLSLNDFANISDPDETAKTFEGNAIIKAVAYGIRTKYLALADDSGLNE